MIKRRKKPLCIALKMVGLAVLASIVQLLLWNAGNWAYYIDRSRLNDQHYTLQDFEAANWDQTEVPYCSLEDPILVLADLNTWVDTIQLDYVVDPGLPYLEIFYVNEVHPNYGEIILHEDAPDGSLLLAIKDQVQNLRIDLGDTAETRLYALEITVNPIIWNFSISIVVAVELIYLCGKFLFWIQRTPDYGLDKAPAEEEHEA